MTKSLNKLACNLANSIKGLSFCLKENSFQLAMAYGIILIPSLFFSLSSIELKIIAVSVYLVMLGMELLNTAIEQLCNKITILQDECIRNIKDISSAAVFLMFLLNLLILSALYIVRA